MSEEVKVGVRVEDEVKCEGECYDEVEDEPFRRLLASQRSFIYQMLRAIIILTRRFISTPVIVGTKFLS